MSMTHNPMLPVCAFENFEEMMNCEYLTEFTVCIVLGEKETGDGKGDIYLIVPNILNTQYLTRGIVLRSNKYNKAVKINLSINDFLYNKMNDINSSVNTQISVASNNVLATIENLKNDLYEYKTMLATELENNLNTSIDSIKESILAELMKNQNPNSGNKNDGKGKKK